jgi:DUF2075 family protein
MAIELINIGNVANDGTGDDLREAFIKINQNFEEIDLRDDEKTTVSNIGAVGEGVFARKQGFDLQFKKLVGGTDVTLNSTNDQITLNANGGLKTLLAISDSGSIILQETASFNIHGGAGINTAIVGNTLTITNTSSEIVTDTTPQLGGNLDSQGFDISNANTITANLINSSVNGNLTGLVYGLDIRNFAVYGEENGWDFGYFDEEMHNILDYIIFNTEVDMGTFDNPNPLVIDLGVF